VAQLDSFVDHGPILINFRLWINHHKFNIHNWNSWLK
jgi:hypothetical protein